jgi:hypothetical protein
MLRARDERAPERRSGGEPPAREPPAGPSRALSPPAVLALQRYAGNAAVSRLLQRTHPAFGDVNYWSTPLPSLDGGPPIPRPGSPEAVLARLRGKFAEAIAQLLLHTEADGQDALDREPMTADFLRDGGAEQDAEELLTANPRDNAGLAAAYAQRLRDDAPVEFRAEGGTREQAELRQAEHAGGVEGLREAYHGDLFVALRRRAGDALARIDALEDARLAMSPPGSIKPPDAVIRVRAGIRDGQRAARAPGAPGRAAWLVQIQAAENWAAAREATVATVPADVRTIMKDALPDLYREPARVVKALFEREPFDLNALNQAWAEWIVQTPVQRLKLETPQQVMDGLTGNLVVHWGIGDGVARPIASQLFSAAARDVVDVLRTNAVPYATWQRLRAQLSFEQTIEAVRRLGSDAQLTELAWRLEHRDYSGANLTAIALTAPVRVTVHHGRKFPYMGPPHPPPTIETELSVTWNNDIWMPSGLNHWGEVHIHYYHRVATQAEISFVHLKTDRAIPGGTPIASNHAIVAHAYAQNLIDPTWTV